MASRKVLCVRREHESIYDPFDINSGNLAIWVDKQETENSEEFRQVIPYCIVCADHAIMRYHRRGSEQRLRGQLSIGVGGHIEEGETFLGGMIRELHEELLLEPHEYTYSPTGLFLNLHSSSVSYAHLGVVVMIDVGKDYKLKRTSEIADPEFWRITELLEPKNYIESEDWTKVCLDWIMENKKVIGV